MSVSTVADLARQLEKRGDREALVLPDQRISYAELGELAERVAAALWAEGVRPGDVVGTLVLNCVELVGVMFGAALVGAMYCGLNPRYRGEELGFVLGHSDVKVLVTTDRTRDYVDFEELLSELVGDIGGGSVDSDDYPQLRRIVTITDSPRKDVLTFGDFLRRGDELGRLGVPRPRPVVSLTYTSGTTARPKGIMLGSDAFVDRGYILGRDHFLLGGGEKMFAPLPLFHQGCIQPLLMTLVYGGTFTTLPYFQPEAAAEIIEQERCDYGWFGFPPLIRPLLEPPLEGKYDLSSLRVAMLAASLEAMEYHEDRLPTCRFLPTWGTSENGGAAIFGRASDPREVRLSAHGRVIDGLQVRAVREDGTTADVGEVGELLVRGRGLFYGYYKEPELTRSHMGEGGWFRTQDLGHFDERRMVTYVGRLKDLIKVGGENVTAAEIEDFLFKHPKVKLAQVVPVPDAKYGEVPAAFIELENGHTCTEEEIFEFCNGRVSRVRVPRYVRFIEDWPMSATKVKKEELRARLISDLNLA
jgi:fatty-acyl-CoA synthase